MATPLLQAVRNPGPRVGVTDWAFVPGTTGVGNLALQTANAMPDATTGNVAVSTWSTATTTVSGGFDVDTGPAAMASAAHTRYGGIWVKSSITQRLQLSVQPQTDAAASVGSAFTSAATVVAANTWTYLSTGAFTKPATATRALLSVRAVSGTSGVVWPIAATLKGVWAQLTTSSAYFDGDSQELSFWTGTANASSSIWYLPVITVTSDSANAKINIVATDGPPAQVAYVIRRDPQGSTLVRETSTGIVVYDGTGSFTISDYEARQGLSTNYLLTSDGGVQVANTTILVPLWGTWLKNPGKPFMNLRVLWNADSSYTRAARRELIPIRGSKYPVAHTDKRIAPSAVIRVATTTTDQAKAFTNLLDDGSILMIDVNPNWGVPIRYISVGDTTGKRAGREDKGLTWEARIWEMQIDEVAAPVGIPAGQTVTYESIPGAFDSYISLAASVATYNDLAAGNWS